MCHLGVVRNGHARWLWAEKLDAKAISVVFSGTHQQSNGFLQFLGRIPKGNN